MSLTGFPELQCGDLAVSPSQHWQSHSSQVLAGVSWLSGLLHLWRACPGWMLEVDTGKNNPQAKLYRARDSREGVCLHLYPMCMPSESCRLRSELHAVMAGPPSLCWALWMSAGNISSLGSFVGGWPQTPLGLPGMCQRHLHMSTVQVGDSCTYFKRDTFPKI